MKNILISLFVIGFIALFGIQKAQATTTITDLSGWAWASNIGWVSFNSSDPGAGGSYPYSVTVSTSTGSNIGTLGGYAWSPNIGWIKFGGLSSFPSGGGFSGNAQIDFSKTGGTSGEVKGWARACAGTINASDPALPGDCSSMTSRTDGWDGWISLSDTNYDSPNSSGYQGTSTKGVTLDPNSGILSGFAWGSDVVGWMSFSAVAGVGGVCVKGVNPECTPVEPPITNLPSCDSFTVNPDTLPSSGGNVTVTWSSSNTTTCQGENFSTGGLTSGSVGVNVTQSASFLLSCSNGATPAQWCSLNRSVIVDSSSNSGLKLFIGKTTNELASLTESNSGHDVYTAKVGNPFALKWVNTLSVDYTCVTDVSNGGNGYWGSSWNISGQTSQSLNTNGVAKGDYQFSIKCQDMTGVGSEKSSSVILKVIKSTETEF